MFINYVALMLINLVIAVSLVALYIYLGLDSPAQKRWVPGFAMTGLVALTTGFGVIFNWPLPGSYNISFGEMSVLFGSVLAGAALALALSWDLGTVAVYALFAGAAAIEVGVRVINLGLTQAPLLAGIGYILTGVGGVLALPTYYLRGSRLVRLITALILIVAAVIWAVIGYGAYWQHLADYGVWKPATSR